MTRRISLFLGALCLAAPFAAAQTDIERPLIPFQFQFAPPGARALGMGATFVAVADDATAAESNPAGLTILTKPEISAHLRSSEFSVEFIDPFSGSTSEFSEKTTSPAFASIVYPFKSAAVSLYYQQATRFKNSSSFSGTLGPFDSILGGTAQVSLTNTADLLLDTVGVSAAYKVTPKVSLGASLRGSRIRFDRTGGTFRYNEPPLLTGTISDDVTDSSRKITFNAGVLVNPNGKISFGAFYKLGGKFELTQVRTSDVTFAGFRNPEQESVAYEYEVPSYFGAGVAFRPSDRLLVSAEAVAIKYSVTSPSARQLANNNSLEAIDDAVEIHAGLEYTLLMGQMPISLRAGAFTDPDHDGLQEIDSDQVHVTAGFGFVAQNRFQVDVAANVAKRVKEGLISLVYRFE